MWGGLWTAISTAWPIQLGWYEIRQIEQVQAGQREAKLLPAVSSQGYQSHSTGLLSVYKDKFYPKQTPKLQPPKNGEEDCLQGLRSGIPFPKESKLS